jgi:NAD(P)-dependent dehydrogenase (short-subunit alcohol dehydrogenase family)
MDLKDAGVVVTGAGSGIGAALARRFAAEGARLVVNDLDGAAAARVAAEIGGLAVPGDAGAEESVAALVAAARAHLGEIDLFCANAGIEPGGGEHTPEEVWDQVWQVNVMGHVRAARHLIGPWLERGRGHFLATVSAAGLLTHMGSAGFPSASERCTGRFFPPLARVRVAVRGASGNSPPRPARRGPDRAVAHRRTGGTGARPARHGRGRP